MKVPVLGSSAIESRRIDSVGGISVVHSLKTCASGLSVVDGMDRVGVGVHAVGGSHLQTRSMRDAAMKVTAGG